VYRDRIAGAAPKWLAIESLPAQARLDIIAEWIEAIMNAIAQDHVEPDTWETLHLARAVGGLAEGQYFASLAFGELALNDPARHRAIPLRPFGAEPITLADLRAAMALIRARPPK